MAPPGNKQKRLIAASGLLLVAVALWARPVYYLLQYEIPREETNVLQCYPPMNPGPADVDVEAETADVNRRFLANLAGSDAVEARLVGALLGNAATTPPVTVREVLEEFPENHFVAMHYLHACANDSGNDACDPSLLTSAANLNRDNGVAWALLAISRTEQGDSYGTVTAMRQAVNAPNYDELLQTNFRLMRAAIPPGVSIFSNALRFQIFIRGIGLNMVNYRSGNVCSNDSAGSSELYRYCLAFGERMENESPSDLGEMIGRGIQQTAYRMMDDMGNYNRIEQETREINDSKVYTPTSDRTLANYLMTWDEELGKQWFDTWIEYGEQAARDFVLEEAIRRSADPDYRPCPGPGLRFEYPFFYYNEQQIVW